MDKRYLLRRLVTPLVVAAVVCVLVSIVVGEPWKGLLVNLSATFLGSIVTVFYVDVVLRRHEETLWQGVKLSVYQRLERIANIGISSVRTAFNIEVPDGLWRAQDDLSAARQEMIRLARVLIPAKPHLEKMGASEWKLLVRNVQNAMQEIDRVITLFGRNLDVEYMNLLLQLQDHLTVFLSTYLTWFDLLEAPYGLGPKNLDGSSSEPNQRAFKEVTSDNIEEVLATCSTLLRQLPPPAASAN